MSIGVRCYLKLFLQQPCEIWIWSSAEGRCYSISVSRPRFFSVTYTVRYKIINLIKCLSCCYIDFRAPIVFVLDHQGGVCYNKLECYCSPELNLACNIRRKVKISALQISTYDSLICCLFGFGFWQVLTPWSNSE